MRRADRLFELIHLLRRARRAITAVQLAETLEVAPRTIYRDIAALMAMGVPTSERRKPSATSCSKTAITVFRATPSSSAAAPGRRQSRAGLETSIENRRAQAVVDLSMERYAGPTVAVDTQRQKVQASLGPALAQLEQGFCSSTSALFAAQMGSAR